MNTCTVVKGTAQPSFLNELEEIKEPMEMKINPNDFITILKHLREMERTLNSYKTKYEILESKFNNHVHVDGTIAVKPSNENFKNNLEPGIRQLQVDRILKRIEEKYSTDDFPNSEMVDSI